MGMKQRPAVISLPGGSRGWTHTFRTFRALVVVPEADPAAEVINWGFRAPYLLVFDEKQRDLTEAEAFAEERGLTDIARAHASSVVFVQPTAPGGWAEAPADLFQELAAESKIQQYYRDGMVLSRDRFTRRWGDCFIRGALFRTVLFGFGASADYIAAHLLQTQEGEYLWGPGEITPMAVVLEGLSVIPAPKRRDIPVVSVGGSGAVNAALQAGCDRLLIREKADDRADCAAFWGRMKRWCGVLSEEEDPAALGMREEAVVTEVTTSGDNRGDDAGTVRHRAGYIAYCPADLKEGERLPLVLAFHGGGDSALHIAWVSGWWRVAMRHRFLLVCPENHLNLTATEVVELIGQLKERYPVDAGRIYASGFSMGGCKSWDLFQEYPEVFAGLAPMSATFEVGLNAYGEKAARPVNRDVPVPVYYAAGEQTPLPELPCQAAKCLERVQYVFGVNRVARTNACRFGEQEQWEDPVWGVPGDEIRRIPDPSRGAVLTEHRFLSRDGVCRTVLAGIDNQGHECREHTCEQAWRFLSAFRRG